MGNSKTGPRVKSSNYEPEELAVIFVPRLFNIESKSERSKNRLSLPSVKDELKAYCLKELPIDGIVKRVMAAAVTSTFGSKEEQVALMPAAVEVLREAGYHAQLLRCDGVKQKKLMLSIAEAKHKRDERSKDKAEREPFDKDSVPLSMVDDTASYFYGYQIARNDLVTLLPTLRSVLCTDAAHVGGGVPGTQYKLSGYDANDHLIVLVCAFYADNECTSTWEKFFSFTQKVTGGKYDEGTKTWSGSVLDSCDEMNKPCFAMIGDRDKGEKNAGDKVLKNVSKFKCLKHLKENLQTIGRCNASEVDIFEQAVYARTPDQLTAAKGRYSDRLIQYLTKTKLADENMYLSATGGLTRGKVASSGAEAMFAAAHHERHQQGPFAGLVFFTYHEMMRCNQHSAAALACKAYLTPKYEKEVKAMALASETYNTTSLGGSMFSVTNRNVVPPIPRNVNLGAAELCDICDCYEPAVRCTICRCVHAACVYNNENPQAHATAHWT